VIGVTYENGVVHLPSSILVLFYESTYLIPMSWMIFRMESQRSTDLLLFTHRHDGKFMSEASLRPDEPFFVGTDTSDHFDGRVQGPT
jgi:hypothetical protein